MNLSDRPRVLVVTTWLPTPADPTMGVFVRRDIQALAQVADLRVLHLVAPRLAGPIQSVIRAGGVGEHSRTDAPQATAVPVAQVPMDPTDPLSVLRAARTLARLCRRGASDGWRPQLVHTVAVSTLLPMALFRPPIAWIHTEHWSGFAGAHRRLAGVGVGGLARLMSRADAVAAVSPDLADRLAHLSARSVQVVPNIVEAGPVRPRPPAPMPPWLQRAGVRRVGEVDTSTEVQEVDQAQGPDMTLRLVAVGGLIDRKRPLLAIRATAELRRRGWDAQLTWVGDGPLARAATDLVTELKVPATLTGAVAPDLVPDYLAQAHLMMLPTAAETFCLAAAEALAVGRPVVVGAQGGQTAFVTPPAGALVDSDQPADWADAIERVVVESAPMSAEQIARPIRLTYSPAALAGAYGCLYTQLLGNSPMATGAQMRGAGTARRRISTRGRRRGRPRDWHGNREEQP